MKQLHIVNRSVSEVGLVAGPGIDYSPVVQPGGRLEVSQEYVEHLMNHPPARLHFEGQRAKLVVVHSGEEDPPELEPLAPPQGVSRVRAEITTPVGIESPQDLVGFTVAMAEPVIATEGNAELLRAWSERDNRTGIKSLIAKRLGELETSESEEG